MRIEDLKIGSLVSYNNCDLRVTALGSRSDIIGLERHPLTAFNRVSPIPLTEEWLIKLGFGKQNGYPFEMLNGYIKIRNGIYFFKYYQLEIELNYVHQLQNLYFALTSKEL